MACTTSRPEPVNWRVYALDYGRSTFRGRQAVRDGSDEERVPFAWMAWLIKGQDRTILVDTGFDDAELARAWGLEGYVRVPEVLAGLEVSPEAVTDVVITHSHWDHMGHLSPYLHATVWMQEDEVRWARSRVSSETPARSGVRWKDIALLDSVNLSMVRGDTEVAPGVHLHRGGGHTEAVQWVEVRDVGRTVVLATDIAYLYENLDREIPPGASRDGAQDLAQIRRMNQTARPRHLLVPGHDPRVFDRFREVAPRVVEIR